MTTNRIRLGEAEVRLIATALKHYAECYFVDEGKKPTEDSKNILRGLAFVLEDQYIWRDGDITVEVRFMPDDRDNDLIIAKTREDA